MASHLRYTTRIRSDRCDSDSDSEEWYCLLAMIIDVNVDLEVEQLNEYSTI